MHIPPVVRTFGPEIGLLVPKAFGNRNEAKDYILDNYVKDHMTTDQKVSGLNPDGVTKAEEQVKEFAEKHKKGG